MSEAFTVTEDKELILLGRPGRSEKHKMQENTSQWLQRIVKDGRTDATFISQNPTIPTWFLCRLHVRVAESWECFILTSPFEWRKMILRLGMISRFAHEKGSVALVNPGQDQEKSSRNQSRTKFSSNKSQSHSYGVKLVISAKQTNWNPSAENETRSFRQTSKQVQCESNKSTPHTDRRTATHKLRT